ncbi:hypothetical protein SKAU_G00227610 [Synaphobranchus kaupii]|uniref:Uncharacterized protein n=1 Tax=Synaphobranchus kaupii TaxID=118154 RepID=A0A9Q1F578_SYNKA|nr:hypothetical protein SKAU_G00227610 [Synaphobranchus kaupii]
MASCPSQLACEPAPSMVACKPDMSVDGEVNTHPAKLDTLAQEERGNAPHGVEQMAEIHSGEEQDLSMRNNVFNLPSASLLRRRGVEQEIQVGRANLRNFLSPSFKSLRFLSPVPEVSPLSVRAVHGKPSEEKCGQGICANVIDEIQRNPYRTALQAVGGGSFFGKSLNGMDSILIGAEPCPFNFSCLDYTMESSCLQLEEEATNKLELSFPHLENLVTVNKAVEESAKKLGAEGEEDAKVSVGGQNASPRFSSQKSLIPLIMEKVQLFNGTGDASSSSTSMLSGTYNLSHCQESIGGQGLLEGEAGDIPAEAGSGVGPVVKEGSSAQSSTNNTLVLHSGPTLTGFNLTVDIAQTSAVEPITGVGVIGMQRANSKNDPFELQSGEIVAPSNLTVDIAESSGAGPNLTVDIMERSSSRAESEDSSKSLGLKNSTFEVQPDPVQEPVSGPNLTMDLTKLNVTGPKMGSTEKMVSQNVTIELQPGQLNEPTNVNLTFNATNQLGSVDDPVGISEAKGGAEGQQGSLTKVGNCDGSCSPSRDMEDSGEGSSWSFNNSIDMKANFLITSTPLVVPKVFSFATKPAPSDACKKLSVVGHSKACSDGNPLCMSNDGNNSSASSQIDQPAPTGVKPPTKSFSRPTGQPLKHGDRAFPSNRKFLARPSGIPNSKLLQPLSRTSSSRLSLAPPQKTLSGPQVPGSSSLLSSALTRIGRKTGGALRNMAATSLEASVSSTTNPRRRSVSEPKLPMSGLQRPRTCGPLPSSSGTSLLALRPSGQMMSKLQTLKTETSSRPLGLGEPKGRSTALPISSLKQPRGSTDEPLPVPKRKKVDTLAHTTNSEAAGGQRVFKRPAASLRGPQSKLQNLGGGGISGALTAKKSGPTAPLPPDVQPAPAQDDCEKCAKYRQEIARLRAELQERDQRELIEEPMLPQSGSKERA